MPSEKNPRLLRIMLSLLLLGLVTAARSGVAVADDRDVAREAFREGTRQFDLGDFKSALIAFKKAYLNHEDAAYLYNIAQCQRQLGEKAEALRSYRVFLNKQPNSPERPQIERIVAELQAAIDHDKAATTQPPTGVVGPNAAGTSNTEPGLRTRSDDPAASSMGSAQPAGAQPADAQPADALTASAPPREKPLTKKPWFWATLAGGAVVVAGAVTLGVVLGTRHANPIELSY